MTDNINQANDAVLAYLKAHYHPDAAADLLAAAQPLMAIAWDEGQYAWESELLGRGSGMNPYRRGVDD